MKANICPQTSTLFWGGGTIWQYMQLEGALQSKFVLARSEFSALKAHHWPKDHLQGIEWEFSSFGFAKSKSCNSRQTVTFQTTFAFLYTYHMQINTGTASFPLSQSIHIGSDSYLVRLHHWSALSLYDTIFLWPSYTISSYTSMALLGRCTSTFA